MTPQKWIESFKQDRNPSPHTIRAYETAFRCFQRFLDTKDILSTTEQDIRAYIATTEAQGSKRVTVCQRLVPLKLYFKTLHESGEILSTPFANIKYIAGIEETERQRADVGRKLLSEVEIRQLINFDWFFIKGKDRQRKIIRNSMLIYLLVDTGRRVSDICRILREDVRGSEIIFNRTKSTTGKGISYISAKTASLIRQYLDLSKDCGNGRWVKGYLVDITEQIVRRNISYAMEVLKIKRPRLNAHAINHFYVSNAINKGVQVDELSEITGKSIATLLKIYNHPSRNRVKEAHKRASILV